jgi:hypothetical protein
MRVLQETDQTTYNAYVEKNGNYHGQNIYPINLESHVVAEAVGNIERGYLRNGWAPSVLHFHKATEACEGHPHRYWIEVTA